MLNVMRGALLCAALVAAGSASHASSVTFTRADIADLGPGEDLWQNTYTFSGALESFGGLNLIFSQAEYGTLSVSGFSPDLSALITQPDTGLGTDGLVTLTALSDQLPSYTTSFVVTYVRLGNLSDSHPYEVFDGNFNIVDSGNAVIATVVSEPSDLTLLMIGGAVLAGRLRRSARSRPQ